MEYGSITNGFYSSDTKTRVEIEHDTENIFSLTISTKHDSPYTLYMTEDEFLELRKLIGGFPLELSKKIFEEIG